MALWEYLWSWSGITKWLYHLNWDANDSSGNGNHGTATNITWVWWKLWSGAASFNGSSKITTVSSNLLNFWTSNFTIVCWVNSSSTGAFSWAISNSEASSWHRRIWVRYFSNNKVTFSVRTSTWDFDLDTWVSVNWSRNNVIVTRVSWVFNIYINWALVLTNNSHTTKNIWKDWTWLVFWFSPADNSYYAWLIDEVIIENRAWTPEQIKKYYTYSKWRFIQ